MNNKPMFEETEVGRRMHTGRRNAAYYRLQHLYHSGVYDGTLAALAAMLNTDDWRLVRLAADQRAILKTLIRYRRKPL